MGRRSIPSWLEGGAGGAAGPLEEPDEPGHELSLPFLERFPGDPSDLQGLEAQGGEVARALTEDLSMRIKLAHGWNMTFRCEAGVRM